jgi:death-on-curing protein
VITEEGPIEFLTVDDVLELHDDQLATYGGSAGIRDLTLVESAVAMAQASFASEYLHADIFAMASAYAFHLAENQPFIDGNKRTGLAAAYAFLALNGYRVQETGERLYRAMMAIAAHELDKSGLAAIFREMATTPEDV